MYSILMYYWHDDDTQYLYSSKVLVLSEYIFQYFSINNAIILILMIYLYCSS